MHRIGLSSTLSHIRVGFSGKSYWSQNVCLDFLYNFYLKHFSFQKELSEMLSQMYIGLHVKYPFFLSDFNKTVSTDFRKILKYQISCPSSGSRVVTRRRTDGWTNGGTWRSQQLFFKILRKRLKSGPHRPYSQKSETDWKQGVTSVGRRQGKDNYKSHISFSAALQPKSGLGRHTVEVSRSHTNKHTHPAELLWTSDQFAAEAATYTIHNKHIRRTSIPSAGFELAIPYIKLLQV
jgi:hypothetical protein